MAKRGKSKGTRKRQHSSLKEHQQRGKVLKPPLLANLPITPSRWSKDALPEFLWIDAVHDAHGWPMAVEVIQRTLDKLDEYMPASPDKVLDGMISSFALIPPEAREQALDELVEGGIYDIAFPRHLRHALALYPDCPASWLFARWRETAHADPVVGLGYLKAAVRRLFPHQNVYPTRCRMVPMARLIKHGKMIFAEHLKTVELLPKYPKYLSADDQAHVESWTRAGFNGIYKLSGPWVPYFWRHSFDVSPCEFAPGEALPMGREGRVDEVRGKLLETVDHLRSSLDTAILQIKLDVYEPDRDEVLLGLLSRQFRLFTALAGDPRLWTPELGNTFQRMLTDGLIVTAWLARRNDPKLFRRYKEHSIGKQKLLKLHLEATADERGDGEVAEEVITDLQASIDEEMWEELVTIDVGAPFEGMDTRKMAQEVGLREWYTFGFAPLSADVHGEWTNLKSFYLQRCINPLHHFHRLPRLKSAIVLAPMVVITAAEILVETIRALASDYTSCLATLEIDAFVAAIAGAFDEPESNPGNGAKAAA